ncbi:hypothetical protein LTR82_002616 [Friedmanniomyces endolithicus]|uniref:EamA domain-containing protein n=1 Tax=Friedmanniomyces endolithicus TaxID=329885 RepID=A0AAN6JE10_9PEZI|nr:hypothetical protein LTR82_002616 [Friedmanniomyces endolithicus]
MAGLSRSGEQTQPFLASSRESLDIELSNLSGTAPRSNDRTPDHHYAAPSTPALQPKSHPRLIALALTITVLGFVINTESVEYVETELNYNKPFASISLALPWICYIALQRFRARHTPYRVWVKEHNNRLREAVSSIDAYSTDGPWMVVKLRGRVEGPLDFLLTSMAVLTVVLMLSGISWFVALAWTTPADLTAIYNSSTFFAAAFSVPLLGERLGWYSIVAVGLSVVGTFVIAYGDTTAKHDVEDKVGTSRLFGNIVACLGALAFGLYEVLFKKWACSSRPTSPQQSLPLTLTASALTGFYTFATAWIILIPLHILGVETFIWPSAKVWLWLMVAILSGSSMRHISDLPIAREHADDVLAVSITMLAVLVVWTDPVFGSFANVLSVFFVALSDWLLFGLTPSLATYVGGGLVIVAFSLLTWDTFVGKKAR